jgi:hypothetical protein
VAQKKTAALLRHSPLLLAGALGTGVVGALLASTAPVLAYIAWAFAFYLALVLLFTGKSRVVAADVAIDRRGIVVDGELQLAKGDIASAYLQPRPGERPLVRVRSRQVRGSLDIVVADEAHGRDLLTQLGQDASRTIAKFRVRSGIESKALRFAWGVATTVLWLVLRTTAGTHPAVLTALGLLWAVMLCASFLPTTLTVGADGVLIDKLWRRRFVPFSAIDSIGASAAHADSIVLCLREGKGQVEIRTRPNDKKTTLRGPLEARDAARERLTQGLAAYRARERSDDATALLARGSRSTEEWLDTLKTLRGDAGYRAPAIPAEHLWRVVEDPSADASARAGALVSLRDSLDEDGHARVRAAVDACASPRVRVALDAATAGDARALTEALDTLDTLDAEDAEARAGATALP